jgi:uncharacterized repeat protein (TIGR01451 family)
VFHRVVSLMLPLAACFYGLAIAQSTTFNYTGGLQSYPVPAGVTKVIVDVSGAAGGAGGPVIIGDRNSGRPRIALTFPGGAGARLVATFTVTPGETLNVVVGGTGATSSSIGGGGGGSFVYRTATLAGLLVAAAGGGGGSGGSAGMAGSANTTATAGQGSGGGVAGNGGINGNSGGGGSAVDFSGAGGGGLLAPNGGNGSGNATGGQALANGAGGGGGAGAVAGGFGGGGAGDVEGAGGGGGYNGGGGGASPSGNSASGGGGGSFSAIVPSISQGGVNTGTGQVIITVVSADLSVTKSGPAAVTAGNNITYTVTVTNNGPSDATNVQLSDTLPPGTTFVSEMQTAGPSFTCTNPSPGATGTVSCTLATLTNGTSASFTIVYKAGASVANGTVFTNIASVSSSTPDPNSANNSASSSATVGASADLSITKMGPPAVNFSNNAIYTLLVNNAGPSNSQNVTVTDVIPSNTSFVSASASQGSCSGTSTVTCSLGTIAAGNSATITLMLHLISGQSVTNTASVTADTPDPNLANNTSTTGAIPVTPLPSSLILILAGLGVLALYRGRRWLTRPG